MNKIYRFKNENNFLSNFYMAPVNWRGADWPSSEHAFQAAKTDDKEEQDKIRKANTPAEAKKLGRLVSLRENWENEKIGVMESILIAKFTQNQDLLDKLLATGDAELVEGNHTFWGVCNGEGKNHLGKLLMKIRDALRATEALNVLVENDEAMQATSATMIALSKYNVKVEPMTGLSTLHVTGPKVEIDKILANGLPGAEIEKDGPMFAF